MNTRTTEVPCIYTRPDPQFDPLALPPIPPVSGQLHLFDKDEEAHQ